MTTNEITQAARRKVLETTSEIVSDSTVLLYANQSYKEVWKRAFTSNQVITADIVCSNGVCTLPSDYGRMYSRTIDSDNNQFAEMSIADYHQTDPLSAFTIDEGDLLITDTEVTLLTIRYYIEPATLTAAVNPSIDEYLHEPIVYGIVWRIHEDLQDEELSTHYKKKFDEELSRRLTSQSAYEEANQRGGEMFGYQTLI